ncbi:MAG: hypothetical protein M3Z01_02995 [Thermoproteota archaeon]|nr:hypothetical protein [Thermoproteota archaeon]
MKSSSFLDNLPYQCIKKTGRGSSNGHKDGCEQLCKDGRDLVMSLTILESFGNAVKNKTIYKPKKNRCCNS